MGDSGDCTRLLEALRGGDASLWPRLLELTYGELRALAERQLLRERRGHTLQPTALVNEAYLRLIEQRNRNWENKAQFLAIASLAMRRILVHHARSLRAEKRGGARARVALAEADAPLDERAEDVVALDEALTRLAAIDPLNARIVELRFFGGLSAEDAARVVGAPLRTVERGWRVTRAWLRREIEKGAPGASPEPAAPSGLDRRRSDRSPTAARTARRR